MGLRDRDYFQDDYTDEPKRWSSRQSQSGGWSVVIIFIFINVALWLANGLLSGWADEDTFFYDDGLTKAILLEQDLRDPSEEKRFFDIASSYRFLTHGFAHSQDLPWHILLNMIVLLMFGYGMMLGIGPGGFGFVRGENVEGRLGRLEFAAFYLLTIIIGGLVFALLNINAKGSGVLGASGAVSGVVILYAWLYPKKTLWLYGVLPLPMWAIGGLWVIMDAMGEVGFLGGGIAYSVHLAGAACGTLYYFLFLKRGIKLTGWIDTSSPLPQPKRKPHLRVYMPEDDTQPKSPLSDENEFNRQLDQVLKRYGEVGETGLTPAEKEFLRRASQRFAEKQEKR